METFIRDDKNQQSFITTVINTMSDVVASNVRDFYVVDTQQRRRLGNELNPIEETDVLLDNTSRKGQDKVEIKINSPDRLIDSTPGPASTNTLSSKLISLAVSVRSGLRLLNNPLVVNSAVLVTYTINCTTIYSGEQLFGQLYTSVSTGAFSEDLFTNANAIGATDMIGVTSLSVNYPCSIDCSNENANWFWWYTALIAAGGFLALMIAVFVGQWCYDYFGKINSSCTFPFLKSLYLLLTIFYCSLLSQAKANLGKLMMRKKITLGSPMTIVFWNFDLSLFCLVPYLT